MSTKSYTLQEINERILPIFVVFWVSAPVSDECAFKIGSWGHWPESQTWEDSKTQNIQQKLEKCSNLKKNQRLTYLDWFQLEIHQFATWECEDPVFDKIPIASQQRDTQAQCKTPGKTIRSSL